MNYLSKTLQISNSKSSLVRNISSIGVVLTILGIIDATYLTIAHYVTKVVLACPDKGFIDCAKVTTSQYSMIFHVPVALLGLLFFIGMFFLQLPFCWRSMSTWFRRVRLVYASIGQIMVFWLVYVEFQLLHSICLFCTAVHILTFGLFITTVIGTALINKESLNESASVKE